MVILELGCGVSEHSLRLEIDPKTDTWKCKSGEWKMPFGLDRTDTTLIRINPLDCTVPDGSIGIPLGALQAMRMLRNHIGL